MNVRQMKIHRLFLKGNKTVYCSNKRESIKKHRSNLVKVDTIEFEAPLTKRGLLEFLNKTTHPNEKINI
jgi:hypothetical protein